MSKQKMGNNNHYSNHKIYKRARRFSHSRPQSSYKQDRRNFAQFIPTLFKQSIQLWGLFLVLILFFYGVSTTVGVDAATLTGDDWPDTYTKVIPSWVARGAEIGSGIPGTNPVQIVINAHGTAEPPSLLKGILRQKNSFPLDGNTTVSSYAPPGAILEKILGEKIMDGNIPDDALRETWNSQTGMQEMRLKEFETKYNIPGVYNVEGPTRLSDVVRELQQMYGTDLDIVLSTCFDGDHGNWAEIEEFITHGASSTNNKVYIMNPRTISPEYKSGGIPVTLGGGLPSGTGAGTGDSLGVGLSPLGQIPANIGGPPGMDDWVRKQQESAYCRTMGTCGGGNIAHPIPAP